MTEFERKFEKAEEFFNEKKYLHAIQIYQSLLNVKHIKRKAAVKLIEIYDIQNQFESAVNVFKRYLSEEDTDEDMLTYYAQFLIRYGKYPEAHEVLSAISNDNRPEKNLFMGIVNYYLKDYEIALINFADYIKRNPKSELLPEAHLFSAKCYAKNLELDSALKHAKESEKIYNHNYEVYLILAIIYFAKEMYFHALDNIQKSIKLNPSDIKSILWSGRIFNKMGEPEQAKKIMNHAIGRIDEDTELLNLLGMIYFELGDVNNAVKNFMKVLQINPSDEEAKEGLLICNSIKN